MTMAVRRFMPNPAMPSVYVRDPRSYPVEIVGVVPDSVRRPDRPLRSTPFAYFPLNTEADVPTTFTLFARAERPDDMAPELRRMIMGLDGRTPWGRVETAAALFASEASPTRSLAGWIGTSGLVALGLASAGLFAVLAYSVSLRSREIGIRIALGAGPSRVTRLVLRQALRLTLVGIVAGYGLALPLAYTIRFVFLGVSPLDPIAMAPVAGALLITTLVAAVLPARRAAAVDPVTVLRAD
jgi:hypothetical protein